MLRYHNVILITSILIILLLQNSIPVGTTINIQNQNNEKTTSSVDITNYSPDPNFSEEPVVVVNSSTGEFTSDHHIKSNDSDFNYFELRWAHTPNTSLDFQEDANIFSLDCFDFIYFYQEFDWTFNEIPIDAELQLNFSTYRTGSFATEETAQIMFKLYAWVIDPSGNWIQILKTYPPYDEIYQERRAGVSYFEMQDIFGGMIENSSGMQEDPSDTLKLVVGLAPTNQFQWYYGEEPWRFYDGSVSMRIKSLEFWVYREAEPDPSNVLLPLFNNTWSHTVKDEFPDIEKDFENESWLEFIDIEVDIDDSVYILCNIHSDYDLWINQSIQFTYQFLLKYDARLNFLWSAKNDNRTRGLGMTIDNGFIYTTGFVRTDDETKSRDLIVTKWSKTGERLWQSTWGGKFDEEGTGITVIPDGSIYIWATYYNQRFAPEFWKSSFLKFDKTGNLLWNKTILEPLLPAYAELKTVEDGIYNWNSAYVEKRDFNCDVLWNITYPAYVVDFDDTGNIFLAYTHGSEDQWQTSISKWNANGEEVWTTNYTITLPDGSPWYFRNVAVATAPDGSVALLIQGFQLIYDFHLIKLDSDGVFQWDKIVGNDRWPIYASIPPRMKFSDNGLVYIGYLKTSEWGYQIGVDAFVIGPYSLGSDLPITLIVIGAAGIGVAVAAIIIYERKYK